MNKVNKTIAIILCLIMATASLAFAEETQLVSAAVKDYEGHWAQATIQKWMDAGKVAGYPDGSYKPDGNVTRAEFVKLVSGIIDFNKKGEVTYKDVQSTEWYYNYVGIAQEIGYISGYSKDSFGPNDYITREQAASILARIQYLNNNAVGADKFNDKSKMSSWAVEAVGAASEAGFISGYNDGSFKPSNNLTRAEAITMLDNVLVNSKNVVVYNAGAELKDAVIQGNLIIAKTVGEGDVHLTNLGVNGEVIIYGGGMNSIYFNNVKIAKIDVEKDKVRLVFADGSTVEQLIVGSETILENIDGTIAKIIETGDNEVTLIGNFAEVDVVGNGNIILDHAVITTLIVDQPITIKGTGTIKTLEAHVNGIHFEAEVTIDKTVVGEGVTEKPSVVKEEVVPGPSGPSGPIVEPVKVYNLKIFAILPNASDSNLLFVTQPYDEADIITDFIVEEAEEVLTGTNDKIEDYLDRINARAEATTINGFKANTKSAWYEIIEYADGIEMANKTGLIDQLYDWLLTKNDFDNHITELKPEDLVFVLGLYEPSQLGEYIELINMHLYSTDVYFGLGYPEIKYNGVKASYKLTVGSTEYNGLEEIMDFVLKNASEDIDTVFGNSSTITFETTYSSSTSSITILKEEY